MEKPCRLPSSFRAARLTADNVFVLFTTDTTFPRDIFAQGWAASRADSPNRKLAQSHVQLFQFTGSGDSGVSSLVRFVAGAARSQTTGRGDRDHTPA
jgi:hypothetical protein